MSKWISPVQSNTKSSWIKENKPDGGHIALSNQITGAPAHCHRANCEYPICTSSSAPVSPKRLPLKPIAQPASARLAAKRANTNIPPLTMSPSVALKTFAGQAYVNITTTPPATPSLHQIETVHISCKTAKDFRIVRLTADILYKHGNIPIGMLGTLLHRVTQDHGLPTYFKESYGGMKKFIGQFSPAVFTICADHRFNPSISLRAMPVSNRFGGMRRRAGADKGAELMRCHSDGGMHSPIPEPVHIIRSAGPRHHSSRVSRGRFRKFTLTPALTAPPVYGRLSAARTAVIRARPSALFGMDRMSVPAAPAQSIFEFSSPFSPRMNKSSNESVNTTADSKTSITPTSEDGEPVSPSSMDPSPHDAEVTLTSFKSGGCKCCTKMSYLEDESGREVMSPDKEFISLQEFSTKTLSAGWSPLQRSYGSLSERDLLEFAQPMRSFAIDDGLFGSCKDMPALRSLSICL